ncbi:MAG TPA: 23S rRNA (guanosine(2251)-2'-O)-methyltransferase RlmB [Candidatus Omnitrophota bacterium]|nr:23S rRNA (guanosine(2251)-2'-O)-methyltransferase RlmB [Candidatus Omnitrophota bacterium]HPS20916.1 23S rRNA (guanosine(2251)-2'-O)-methyltransferase RlmB [Candidatus Omnitrophota bacterium]
MRLYGKNPVLERIRTRPKTIKRLLLRQKTDLSEIVREAKSKKIDFESVDRNDFDKLCGDINSQGVIAEVDEFEYADFNAILPKCLKNGTIPVFLDNITDPQNLGSIIRNLACLGGFAIILPEYESAHVTESVLRVACGGENHMWIAKMTNIARGMEEAKEQGFHIIGTVAEPEADDITTVGIPYPVALVIGSEEKGIRPGLRKLLDTAVTIPMPGAKLSYNVSVATSLVCYELMRRKHIRKTNGE